jgi:general secretion pathway protein J
MRRRANPSGRAGFTLLEVIITLTILGFIVLIISGAFRLGLSAWDRGEQTREEYQRQRTATQLISRQIKSVMPYKIKTQKAEGDYLAFEGKGQSLKFVSTLSLKAARPEGLVFAIYEFKEDQEGGRLVVYEKRVVNKDFFEEGPKEEEGVSVLEGLSNVRFEYYREEDPEKTRSEGWADEWNAKDERELPRALRMTVTFKNGKSEKEETQLTLLSSISAQKFEELKALPTGFGGRAIRRRLQGQ